MKIKDKIDKKTGVIITYPNNKSPVVSIPVSSFPFNLWKEWNKDCKENYNDCRWTKIWSDHLKAKYRDEKIMRIVEEQKETEEKKENLGLLNPEV